MFCSQLKILVVISLVYLAVDGFNTVKKRSMVQVNGKHRQRRQFAPIVDSGIFGEDYQCFNNLTETCAAIFALKQRNGAEYAKYLGRQPDLFPNHCLSTQNVFNIGGLLDTQSNFLNERGLSMLLEGRIAPVAAAAQNLLPAPSVSLDNLLAAGYVVPNDQAMVLTRLGLRAVLAHHILPSQLSELGAFPLSIKSVSLPLLTSVGYVNENCLPTDLGNLAISIGYMNANFPSNFDCPFTDQSQINVQHLMDANYVDSSASVITTIGLASMQSKFLAPTVYQDLGLYPFNLNNNYANFDAVQYSKPTNTHGLTLNLANAGFINPSSHLLTQAAFHAIMMKYMTINNYRTLNLWPYQRSVLITDLINAGHVDSQAQFTALGNWLADRNYYSPRMLHELGIHTSKPTDLLHYATMNRPTVDSNVANSFMRSSLEQSGVGGLLSRSMGAENFGASNLMR